MTYTKSMNGSALLEGLIAILVFSMGVLALLGLQANSINAITDSKYRTDAAFLASQLMAQMSADAQANRPGYVYNGVGGIPASLQPWIAQVNSTMIDSVNFPPTVQVVAGPLGTAGGGGLQHTVTITIFYRPPKTATPHRFVSTGVIS